MIKKATDNNKISYLSLLSIDLPILAAIKTSNFLHLSHQKYIIVCRYSSKYLYGKNSNTKKSIITMSLLVKSN